VLANADDAELRWLYENCRFTVFASHAEGFGLPVAESLARGKACLASNAMSIPEAGQGLAIHLDPTDAAAWRAAAQRLIDDDAELAAREAAVRAQFRVWTWTDTADDALAALAPLRGRA
jgi:glycosyltransferase involved in cell wall biosynthesis